MYARLLGPADAGEIDRLFRDGTGALFVWTPREAAGVEASMAALKDLLTGLAPQDTFPGLDRLRADRQSFWLASRGLGTPFTPDPAFLESLDGDPAGGRRGAAFLHGNPQAGADLETLKESLDRALALSAAEVGIPRSWYPALTVRYRVIRYAPLRRRSAGIGMHPDGSVLSALVTDRPGLTLWRDAGTAVQPARDGTLVLPGSILHRWSEGRYDPTFHRVEVGRDAEPKFSMVAFLNFPDRSGIPRRGGTTAGRVFPNDVQACKEDDMDRGGGHWQRFAGPRPATEPRPATGPRSAAGPANALRAG
ncbi:2OG-Fe(II) oxygenase family protein [Kitasatospora kazusensis]